MRKALAVLGTAIFLVVAPGFVAGLVPRWISRWRLAAPFFGVAAFRFAGAMLIAIGFAGVLECFARFALKGIGTPAPVFPAQRLVVSGMYRYVRNPMYIAVVAMIFGQALLFGNAGLLEYGALIWLLFHLFVLIYEEPVLRDTYGAEYEEFCGKVPRWIPRFHSPDLIARSSQDSAPH